ncbi:endonuclease MutS2 [bacterium]|nr:endonuclease MutS2 [bacterium]
MDITENSLNALEFDKILEILAGYTKCKQSRQLCLDLKPAENIEDVIKSQIYTREAKRVLDIPSDIPIDFVADIEAIESNSLVTYLNGEELVDIAKTFRTSRLIRNFMNENTELDSQLNTLARNLTSDKEIEERIFSVFDENMEIKKDATPELKGLYASLRETERAIRAKVGDLLNSTDFVKHLQEAIYTTRDDRIVFQVKASDKSKVNGIVHDVSATNKTFYIEPESLVPLNNKLRETQSQIHAECVRILAELTQMVKFHFPSLKKSENILAEIDFHFAKARYAVKIHSTEPEILTDKKEIVLEKMKHPLLIGTVENVVTNDFEIGRDYKSIVITGSNTGGKTVTLKTIGLYILMTRAGMFLPCNMAKIYPFKKVYADIGDAQSILQSLSTFSSHMKNIIEIVNNSDEETFVLLDEICAGTDPVEGAVLAKSILEKLAENNVMATVTTHYGELKALEYSNPYFKNASVEFNTDTLKPTYRLLIGIPGLSNAIAISANLGLDKSITDRAKETLVSQKDPSLIVVEKLQETQQQLNDTLEETEKLKLEAEIIKKEYEKKLSEVKNDKKKAIKDIKRKFDYELLNAKAEIKKVLDEIRKEKSEKIARRAYSRLGKLEGEYHTKVGKHEDIEQYGNIDWAKVKINDKLLLKDIHQLVTVLELPDKKGNLLVQMGGMKAKMNTEKLAPYDEAYETKAPVYSPSKSSSFRLHKIDISNTLDLRGVRVEDGLDKLDEYLDKASLANLSPVTIIHGHGTGAMKAAVRDYLSSSPYVAKFRPGEDSEGGDGVSVVDIK